MLVVEVEFLIMKVFNRSIDLMIPPSVKILALPLLSITLGIGLTVAVLSNGLTRLRTQMDALSSARKNEEILEQKTEILRSLSATLLERSDRTLTAVPSKNPVLWYLSQLKQLSARHSVFLDDIKITFASSRVDESSGEIKMVVVVKGTEQNIIDLISELSEIAPLTKLANLEIEKSQGLSEATVNISTSWHGRPETIPAISEPIKDLSALEIDLLERVFGLRQPAFTSLDPSLNAAGKPNPFE